MYCIASTITVAFEINIYLSIWYLPKSIFTTVFFVKFMEDIILLTLATIQ